jgi:hypothetical protein
MMPCLRHTSRHLHSGIGLHEDRHDLSLGASALLHWSGLCSQGPNLLFLAVSREATFYNWKKRYAGMGVSELPEPRLLREKNARLKQLVADLSLDKRMLEVVVAK